MDISKEYVLVTWPESQKWMECKYDNEILTPIELEMAVLVPKYIWNRHDI